MKRITISLEDDLYRIAKAYAISMELSVSKAVTRLLRKAVEAPRAGEATRVSEEAERYRYIDPRSGILISRGASTISEGAIPAAEEEEDQRKWEVE
jgi:hypothetical protein